ncbi:OmpA family protein [Sorangium sp. So ce131]|uniref:OmpA family protein n=1 Tax=Sorangium sp. So ce131 TaxID=3133282 RepID=UPI003F622C87
MLIGLQLGAGSLVGCRKDSPEKTEVAPSKDSVKQSYEGLKTQFSGLTTKFADMRKQIEALPPDLPGLGEVRGKLFTAEEVLGVTGAKLTWLSGRLDAALQAEKGDELQQVSKEIAETADEIRQIDRVSLEVSHQLLPLERTAALRPKAPDAGSASFARVLPTGYEVKAAEGGVEQRLIELIEDPKRKVDKTTWFDFDRQLFASGGSKLDAERAKDQLQNVFEILKAYPTVKLTIGGYTDAAGPAAANKKLSTERAQAVKKELVRLGVAAPRLDAGGKEHPICAASGTEECKDKSRRVAVRVTAK